MENEWREGEVQRGGGTPDGPRSARREGSELLLWRDGRSRARPRRSGLGKERAELRTLFRRELGFTLLNGADASNAELCPEPLDLADLCFHLCDVGRISVLERRQVRLSGAEIGLVPCRLLLEVSPQFLEALDLAGGESKLIPVPEHDGDERAFAPTLRRRSEE